MDRPGPVQRRRLNESIPQVQNLQRAVRSPDDQRTRVQGAVNPEESAGPKPGFPGPATNTAGEYDTMNWGGGVLDRISGRALLCLSDGEVGFETVERKSERAEVIAQDWSKPW